jgi:hypothetical protein
MDNTLKDFNQALCDVRKAHRLIHAYQTKMPDLVYFIRSKLDFPKNEKVLGRPWASGYLPKKNGSANLWPGIWGWDFLYSYMFEYYLGEKEITNGTIGLSLIQYSDTGFFDAEENQWEEAAAADIECFANEEKAGTKLMFYIEQKPKSAKDWIWNIEKIVKDKKYASMKHDKDVIKGKKGEIQIIYSFPLDRFLNEETTIATLKEFIAYCEDNGIHGMSLT